MSGTEWTNYAGIRWNKKEVLSLHIVFLTEDQSETAEITNLRNWLRVLNRPQHEYAVKVSDRAKHQLKMIGPWHLWITDENGGYFLQLIDRIKMVKELLEKTII